MVAVAPRPSPGAEILTVDLEMVYGRGPVRVQALAKLNLQIREGQFVCVMGPSGSGKSTLLHVLAGLLHPTGGQVVIGGTPVQTLTVDEAARWRRRNVGVVHQFFSLIPTLTVVQNVAVPMLLEGHRLRRLRDRVDELLDQLDLLDRRDHEIDELSGGEMQRIAIARALMARPQLILADEPTGNLDSRTASEIMALFRRISHDQGVTTIMMTHDNQATTYADRVIVLRDGQLAEDTAPLE